MYDPSKSKVAERMGTFGDTIYGGAARIIVYGKSGSGKTQLIGGSQDALVFDMGEYGENKVLAESKTARIQYVNEEGIYAKFTADLRAALRRTDVFDPDGGPLANKRIYGIDSWTKLNELMLAEICAEAKIDLSTDRPLRDQYMQLGQRQPIIMKMLKEISMKHNIAVVVTALDCLEGAEDEQLKRDANDGSAFDRLVGMPNMIGSYRYKIMAEFTEVYYMETVPGGPQGAKHRIWTQPHNGYLAKSRFDLPASIDVPKEHGLTAILKVLAEAQPKVEAQPKA